LICFCAILFSYRVYSAHILQRVFGENTEQQIGHSFQYALQRDYETLFLGNSRFYRGIIPTKYTVSTSYNFAGDNESFNHCYYKMKYLEQHHKQYKYLIMSVDYSIFGTFNEDRNYIYKKYFGEEYLKDYSVGLYMRRFNTQFNRWLTNYFSRSWQPILSYYMHRERYKQVSYVSPYGNYVSLPEGNADENDFINRASSELPLLIEKKYFDLIFDYCSQHQIQLFLVMMPMRDKELKSYEPKKMRLIEKYWKDKVIAYHAGYLDYARDPRFTMNDYLDFNHLNAKGAEKFTALLSSDMAKLIKGQTLSDTTTLR
ncbi:MAG: hypothetical protein WCG87_12190, partial [Bacteroidota bacterium]